MRSQRRHARRAVLVGLAFTIVAHLALGAVVHYCVAFRDPEYASRKRRLDRRLGLGAQPLLMRIPGLAAEPDRTGDRPLLVVTLGSSRTIHGIRGQSAEEVLRRRLRRPVVVFNLGAYGAGPAYHLLTLGRLLDEGRRPDLILVEVLPPSMTRVGVGAEVDQQRWALETLRPEELPLLAWLDEREPDGLRRAWWYRRLTAPTSSRQAVLTALVPTLLHLDRRLDGFEAIDDSGWIPVPRRTPEQERQQLARQLEQIRPQVDPFELSPVSLQSVRRVLARCRREKIPVALLLMPEGPAMRSIYPPGAWDRLTGALARLTSREGGAILDLRCVCAEDQFVDSHHLTPAGADRFARLLADRLVPFLSPFSGRAGSRRP